MYLDNTSYHFYTANSSQICVTYMIRIQRPTQFITLTHQGVDLAEWLGSFNICMVCSHLGQTYHLLSPDTYVSKAM